MTQSDNEFQQWLNQPDHYDLIRKTAKGLCRRMTMANLRLPGADPWADRQAAEEVVCQELVLYLMETPNIRQMLIQDPSRTAAGITRYFLNHVNDLIRGREHSRDVYKDNWRAFRRRVLTVLNTDGRFTQFKAGKDIAFGLSDQARPVFLPPEDVARIPYPEDVPADYEGMNHKREISRLAIHFWESCETMANAGPVRISLNDFLAWVAVYVPLQTTPVEDTALTHHATEAGPDMDVSYLKTWANNFCNRLDDRQKAIFFYYECQGCTGQEVARLLGRKSHLTYQRDALRETLRDFLCPLDWVSPDPARRSNTEDPEEAFRIFMEELCERLGRTVAQAAETR